MDVSLPEVASALQVVASLSVTGCALLVVRQMLRADEAASSQQQQQGSAPGAGGSAADDRLVTALAELSAQWLSARPDEEAPGGPAPGVGQQSGAPFAWPSDVWSSSSGEPAAASWVQPPPGAAAGATFVDAVWEAAQQPIKQQELVAQQRTGQQRVGRARRNGAGGASPAYDQSAPAEALPSLLLLALSPGPRARLLGEAMAAVRQEMQLQLAASPSEAPSNGDPWSAAAQKTAAAAVLRAGAAWVMSYPSVAAQVAAEGAWPAVAGSPASGLALVAAAAAQPASGGQEQQASGLAAALRAAGEAATNGEALGTRTVMYGALLRTMSQQARGDGAGHASGTLLSAAVLQDMAVTVAEAVTAAYIAWARGDTVPVAPPQGAGAEALAPGAPSNSFAPLTDPLAARSLLLPRLRSTRPLERFRNEVALSRALHWAFGNVRQAFEDRQPLWGLGASGTLLRREVPVSRRAELDAMEGLQRTVCLLLEAADVVGPLLKRVGRKFGDLVSWLLVTLIGRSLGLVARGVRQSVSPGSAPSAQ